MPPLYPASSIPWKKIFAIAGWLWLFPPWGLWLLWKDAELSRVMKWRILIYSFFIPTVIMLGISLFSAWRLGTILSEMNV